MEAQAEAISHMLSGPPEENGGTDEALSLQRFSLPQVISYLLGKHACNNDVLASCQAYIKTTVILLLPQEFITAGKLLLLVTSVCVHVTTYSNIHTFDDFGFCDIVLSCLRKKSFPMCKSSIPMSVQFCNFYITGSGAILYKSLSVRCFSCIRSWVLSVTSTSRCLLYFSIWEKKNVYSIIMKT